MSCERRSRENDMRMLLTALRLFLSFSLGKVRMQTLPRSGVGRVSFGIKRYEKVESQKRFNPLRLEI